MISPSACVCFILSVKVMRGQTLNTQLQVSQFDAFTELFCSNCKCEWLSATRVQPHTLCQYLPVGVNGSTTWQRAACLTWWNLQDHPLVRANKARDLPADRDVFPRSAASSWPPRFHLLSDTGEKMSVHFDKSPRQHLDRVQQLDAIRAFFHVWRS